MDYVQTYDDVKVNPRLSNIRCAFFENTYEYDYLGRINKIICDDSTNSFNRTIEYESIALDNEIQATSNISQVNYNLNPNSINPYSNALTFNYVYDRLNNISGYNLVANNNLSHLYNNHYYEYTYNNDSVLTKEAVWERDVNQTSLSYKEINYTYDLHGNITSKNIKTGLDEDHISTNTTYNYDYFNNRLTSINASNNYERSTFTYDYFGNTTSIIEYQNNIVMRELCFNYIRGSVLSSIIDGDNTYNYHYNSDGIRYKKVINNIETIYGLDENKIIYEKSENIFLYLYK